MWKWFSSIFNGNFTAHAKKRLLSTRSPHSQFSLLQLPRSHTDRQYCAVDSITASSTPCSCNQIRNRCNSLGSVTNRRRAGFSSGTLVSTTTTIKTFLCTSIPATFIASSWRGSGRTHAKKVTHRHVLPPLFDAGVARHRLVQNGVPDQTQKRPHFIQSVNRSSPSTLHQRTPTTQPHFHVNG